MPRCLSRIPFSSVSEKLHVDSGDRIVEGTEAEPILKRLRRLNAE